MEKSGHGLLLALVSCCVVLLVHSAAGRAAEKPLKVLATTFPMYQITRNITANASGIEVALMIPAELGCPHDYALAPQDMRKLAAADVLVVNGLGLEEFLGAPLKKAHPGLKIIDSSAGIRQVMTYTGPEHEDHGHSHGPPEGVANPHLFASPRMAALLAGVIAKGLADLHPAGAATYMANGQAYSQRMNLLTDELAALGKRLRNNRIVTQHGVFDYLARDMGLEVVAVIQAHAGQDPAAAEILKITGLIREKKAGAIFTEPQYPQAIGKTIAREAGIAAATLDPAANGPEEAPLDYYEQIMRTNLRTLEKTLGAD
jgi:ABC-type Zn uptake system ZnuABC Zn-binding protein ZnuA